MYSKNWMFLIEGVGDHVKVGILRIGSHILLVSHDTSARSPQIEIFLLDPYYRKGDMRWTRQLLTFEASLEEAEKLAAHHLGPEVLSY